MLIFDLIILILLAVFVYFLIRPIPLRELYKRYNPPITDFELNLDNVKISTFNRKSYRQYLINENTDVLLVWFHGGSFVQEKFCNIIPFLNELATTCSITILTFDYPLLYNATINETLSYINQILQPFFENNSFKNVFYGGDSAGTYLALKTIELEINNSLLMSIPNATRLNILPNGFIGIAGFYDATFNNSEFLSWLFNLWLWRANDFSNLKTTRLLTRALIITSTRDFLNRQSVGFIQSQPGGLVTFHQFRTSTTVHGFISNITLPETIDTIKLIKNFIVRETTTLAAF